MAWLPLFGTNKWQIGLILFKILPVFQRLAVFPGTVVIAEIDPFAERRMRASPHVKDRAGARIRKILFLQNQKGISSRFVILRDLQPKNVRLVLQMPRKTVRHG